MKLGYILAISAMIAAVGAITFRFVAPTHYGFKSNEKGFAVVELFTSEGCSSCPPADKLVASTLEQDKNKPVYILSYHVDYWDRLGWKDKFSDAAYTERQQEYADWLHENSVYTPQIVVNGKEEFVGSNKAALDKALSKSLSDSAKNTLDIEASVGNNQVNVQYTTANIPQDVNLVVSLIQKAAETSVKGGENSGRKLSHVQIVRKQIVRLLSSNSGSLIITLPPDFSDNEWEVIGFIQNKSNGNILCAAKSTL